MTESRVDNPYTKALKRLRKSFVQAGLFSAVINVLMLTGPLYMLQIYDRVLASGSIPTLTGLFIIVVALYCFLGAYEFFRARILSRAAYRFDEMVGEATFKDLVTQQGHGSTAMRDLDILRGFLSGPALRGLFDVPWIPVFLIAIFIIHPWLGYLTLAGAAVVTAFALINQWATLGAMSNSLQQDAQERRLVAQVQRNSEAVRALGMRQALADRWRVQRNEGLHFNQKAGDRSEGVYASSRAFRLLLQSLLLTAGAYLALTQEISAGMIVGTSIIAGRALTPVDQAIGQWPNITRALEAHRRLKQTLGQADNGAAPVRLPPPTGEINLQAVTKFMPQGARAERGRILNQVSFELDPGDVLGVIGNSASGKSSLARILVGAWAPDMGEVRMDGATLSQWSPDDLGAHIGYLPQHVELLPGTINENIARFDPEAKEQDIFQAARIAGVHDLILALPEGYATQVGSAAQPLSGGQVQRIGLARALYGLPKFIVLDEPNAHLDIQGDGELTETIKRLKQFGSTIVIMAHRPGVLSQANKILILHKGQVAQFGSREEIFHLALRSAPTGEKKVG